MAQQNKESNWASTYVNSQTEQPDRIARQNSQTEQPTGKWHEKGRKDPKIPRKDQISWLTNQLILSISWFVQISRLWVYQLFYPYRDFL